MGRKKIERIAKQRLFDEHKTKGETWYSRYTHARDLLISDILPYIRKEEPNLTDHGPDHVADVLQRASQLLDDEVLNKMPSQDLYGLLLCILFHDVGNIFKRDDHQKKVQAALESVWPDRSKFRGEYNIVKKAVMAHCGTASNGSNDTLRDIDETIGLDSYQVHLQQIAAITRFADELAEGPQRTSTFMINSGLIDEASMPYHAYANQTEVLIERDAGRIALSYEIEIDTTKDDWQTELGKTLNLIYKRINKLDEERQYTKFYSKYLQPFQKTTIAFNFVIDGVDATLDLQKITLTDLKIPGDSQKNITDCDSCYEIPKIIESIMSFTPGA